MGKKSKNKGPSKAQLKALAAVILGERSLEESAEELTRLGIDPNALDTAHLSALQAGAEGLKATGDTPELGELDLKGLPPLLGAAWVESLVQLKAPKALQALSTQAPNKGLRRDAKGALRRLAQGGVEIPAAITSIQGSYRGASYSVRAAVSGVDYLGQQLVALLIQDPGEETLCFDFIYDETKGLSSPDLQPTTVGRFERDFFRPSPESTIRLVEVPPAHALHIWQKALDVSTLDNGSLPIEFHQILNKAAAAYPPAAVQLPGAGDIPPLFGEACKAAYEALLPEPEILGWQPSESGVQDGLKRLTHVTQSSADAPDDEKRDRLSGALLEGAKAYFTPSEREKWVYRLESAALVLAATGRVDSAGTALGFAKSVGDIALPVKDIPMLQDLYAGHVLMELDNMFGPKGAKDAAPIFDGVKARKDMASAPPAPAPTCGCC